MLMFENIYCINKFKTKIEKKNQFFFLSTLLKCFRFAPDFRTYNTPQLGNDNQLKLKNTKIDTHHLLEITQKTYTFILSIV